MASVKCPKCGTRVSIDGVGRANSALCFSCGASVLVPIEEPHMLEPLAVRRDALRAATWKPPKPEGARRQSGPLLNLSVLDPVVDLDAIGALSSDKQAEDAAPPAHEESAATPPPSEPAEKQVEAGLATPPLVPARVVDKYNLDTLPRLQDTGRIAKQRAQASKTRMPADAPPPLPGKDWLERSLPPAKGADPRVDPMAMLSFVFGFASFLCGFGPVLSIPGLILGLSAMVRISGSRGRWKGKEMARIGAVTNALNLVVVWAIFLSR